MRWVNLANSGGTKYDVKYAIAERRESDKGRTCSILLDGEEIYRNPGAGAELSEPFFAILNFAKINDSPMLETWTLEVDWVKHERRAGD